MNKILILKEDYKIVMKEEEAILQNAFSEGIFKCNFIITTTPYDWIQSSIEDINHDLEIAFEKNTNSEYVEISDYIDGDTLTNEGWAIINIDSEFIAKNAISILNSIGITTQIKEHDSDETKGECSFERSNKKAYDYVMSKAKQARKQEEEGYPSVDSNFKDIYKGISKLGQILLDAYIDFSGDENFEIELQNYKESIQESNIDTVRKNIGSAQLGSKKYDIEKEKSDARLNKIWNVTHKPLDSSIEQFQNEIIDAVSKIMDVNKERSHRSLDSLYLNFDDERPNRSMYGYSVNLITINFGIYRSERLPFIQFEEKLYGGAHKRRMTLPKNFTPQTIADIILKYKILFEKAGFGYLFKV